MPFETCLADTYSVPFFLIFAYINVQRATRPQVRWTLRRTGKDLPGRICQSIGTCAGHPALLLAGGGVPTYLNPQCCWMDLGVLCRVVCTLIHRDISAHAQNSSPSCLLPTGRICSRSRSESNGMDGSSKYDATLIVSSLPSSPGAHLSFKAVQCFLPSPPSGHFC